MKKLLHTTALTLALMPAIASASPYYWTLSGAVVSQPDYDLEINGRKVGEVSYDTGYGLNTAVGYVFNENIRLEGELSYRTNDQDKVRAFGITAPGKGDQQTLATIANLYYDFTTYNPTIIPYVGVGAGVVYFEGGIHEPALQGMVGANYKLANDDSIFAGYKALVSRIEDGNYEQDYVTNSVEVGYRVNF